jgi:hypothetical protein
VIRILVLALALGSSGGTMTAGEQTRATGTFDVKIAPQPVDDHSDAGALGRMAIDKTYHGDIEGTAIGQMLTGMSPTEKTSGVYVAVERVTATLAGRKGTFILHHTGVMDRGAQSLKITVVPDSGTEQLTGLTGTMAIDIRDGKHFYTFEYALPAR